MQIASHLTKSRHNVFYFRFPIPLNLHPKRKQSNILLSLQTRCPQEALQISRVLGYIGDKLINQAEAIGMEYQKIREVIQEHFKSSLERHQQRIAVEGRLSELDKTALLNSSNFALDALKKNDYSFMGDDDQMIRLIDTYTLPIKPETKEYSTLRTEFIGFRHQPYTTFNDHS